MTKFSKILDKLAVDKYSFIIRRIAVRGKLDEAVELILDIATQEEPIQEIPASLWQHFKLRWFPRWLKRKFPPKMVWVVAVHTFPELAIPPLGREYVSLKIVDSDKLIKELEGDEKK